MLKPSVYFLSALAIVVGCWALFNTWLSVPVARVFGEANPTSWRPEGPRTPSYLNDDIIPKSTSWYTMHGDLQQSDEMWIAAAPSMELDWVAEPDMFVPEGPTFDNEGRLFFSPLVPKEDVSLVALDAKTGERLWTLPGGGNGGGAPLVLNNPDIPSKKVVYHSTYSDFWAVATNGKVIWREETKLPEPDDDSREYQPTHQWGVSYVPQADAVIGVTMNAYVFAHDRKTGRPVAPVFRLPGRPTKENENANTFPALIVDKAGSASLDAFGVDHFTRVLQVIYGGTAQVSNAYAVDPHTGRIYIAATARDEIDGRLDGYSDNGAIYVLELLPETDGYRFEIAQTFVFDGGSGSTPALSQDGKRLVVSDEVGNVIALNAHTLVEDWRLNVGDQLVASVAISSDNNELYAVTKKDVFKLIDHGSHASLAWKAELDAYPTSNNFNALTPTIVANGLLIAQGAGVKVGKGHLMSNVGIGLLDRDTGRLRSFAEGREDSISVTTVGPDGEVYTAGSPIRRMAAKALFGDRIPKIVGGISRYKNTNHKLLARESLCAAAYRAKNAADHEDTHPQSAAADKEHVRVLLEQAARNDSQYNSLIHELISGDLVLRNISEVLLGHCPN
ncbi:PQQ-binding-like beta-propeller repeat protein [Zhongshania aquimaris]|uniref:PQQ-binding-like beta-propeller repeat protein n=1 Tax=Zhongshania aquimaris TaxID=2857107 RepID=A0ABS6VQQ6_9GAMM|nr:PQQ-binding-like beta-propeller repeat protein [Zhongshania aquimaris]MBW2940364.1 PQQ-binding-like beta-propeller repeat protein [Zhongshania aquimaris]